MSRLEDQQDSALEAMVLQLRADIDDYKMTPQLTSNASGVVNYQVPATGGWQAVELTDKDGNVTEGVVDIPVAAAGSIRIDAEFTPKNQKAPVVYPYLECSINGVSWVPTMHLGSLALILATPEGVTPSIDTFLSGMMDDLTDYSQEDLVFKYQQYIYASGAGTLRVSFRLRSSDTGEVKVKVKLYT